MHAVDRVARDQVVDTATVCDAASGNAGEAKMPSTSLAARVHRASRPRNSGLRAPARASSTANGLGTISQSGCAGNMCPRAPGDVDAAELEASYRRAWEADGGQVVELSAAERAEFVARVQPLRDELRRELGSDLVPELP